MKELVNDFFDNDQNTNLDQKREKPGTISKYINENPAASKKRQHLNQLTLTEQEIPKKINFINNDIDLTSRKTSYLNATNHNKLKKLSDLYNIPMAKIENNIIDDFFNKNKALLNEELNKRQNGF